MRPENNRRTRRNSLLARARMLVKVRLQWLRGVPHEGKWVEIPSGAVRALDGMHLSKATRAIKMLRGEYRSVLPLLFNKPEQQIRRMEAQLARLKPWVNEGAIPEVATLDVAISWVWAVTPEQMDEARKIGRMVAYDTIPLVRQLQLVVLGLRAGREELGPLLGLLREQAVPTRAEKMRASSIRVCALLGKHSWRSIASAIRADQRAPGKLPPARLPVSGWPSCVDALIDVLLESRSPERGLALLRKIDLQAELTRWKSWWAVMNRVHGTLDRWVRGGHTPPVAKIAEQSCMLAGLEQEPATLYPERFLEVLPRLWRHDLAGVFDALGSEEAADLVCALGLYSDEELAVLLPFLREARLKALEGSVFQDIIGARSRKHMTYGMLRSLLDLDAAQRRVWWTAVRGLQETEHGEVLVDLVGLESDPCATRAWLDAQLQIGWPGRWAFYNHASTAACYFGPDAPEKRAQMLLRMNERGLSDNELRAAACLPEEVRWLMVEERQLPRLASLGARLLCAKKGGGPEPRVLGDRGWMTRYPERFHAALTLLAHWSPCASRTAHRILGKHWPDPAAIAEQIAYLTAKGGCEERVEMLRVHRERPRPISEGKMDRLAEKVRRTALLACLEAWERYADDCVRKYSEALFGTEPAWADEQWSRTLHGVRELLPEHRNVAIRVITARMSDPPWDLRNLRRNAAFLDTLHARGLDTTPWLEGVSPVEEHGLIACFENDPLEAALMGWHFQTCLRPGGMNYFSVWSNLIDINKRVVYVRRGKKVVGRCLVGLTDVGGMVTFHVYAMEDSAQITELVQRYVGAVAHAMGTVLLPQGQVPTVVSRHWYDDGPRDLGGQFPDLKTGSDYRNALCEVPLDEIAARVGDAFGELGLSALTLPLLLNLPETDERPELLYVIAESLMQAEISTESWLAVAALLCKLDDPQLSHRLLGQRLPTLLTRFHRRRGFLDAPGMALLISTDPISALRVLRQTRARRRTDEIRPQRLLWEGLAYARLERKNRAIDVFTRLIEAFPQSGEARQATHAREALR